MNKHQLQNCPCGECRQHKECIVAVTPKWICLMPKKINKILIGPFSLRADCLFEVKDSNQTLFKIIDKYVHPDFLSHMITLSIMVPSFLIMKPGELLASLCVVLIEDIEMTVPDNNGKLI